MTCIRFGPIYADVVDTEGALERILTLCKSGDGGFVVTPNVDHIVLAQSRPELAAAYDDASLSLADGMPLLWMAKAMGHPLPEKVSGSDLVRPLMALARDNDLRVFLMGGIEGVAQRAADILTDELPGLQIVGIESPPMGFENNPEQTEALFATIRKANPHLLLVALGCPKQELWMHQSRAAYAPAVALGIGASLDFIAGTAKRAPAWMSGIGLEWFYRLCQEPGRMARRYLVRDRAIVPIFFRMLRSSADDRTFER